MCRKREGKIQFFLIHPGGPFYVRKNEGVWSLPKGLVEKDEDPKMAALREFFEETGIQPIPPFRELGVEKMKSGKLLHVWSFIGEWDETNGITSNLIEIEWPPRSGKSISIPEADKAEWMDYEKAIVMMNTGSINSWTKQETFTGTYNYPRRTSRTYFLAK